jgi:diguanylate cyclase (GGDEF)-like protein
VAIALESRAASPRPGRVVRLMIDRAMRRPRQLVRPVPCGDGAAALVRLVPGRLDRAAALALALFAALVAARPWLPAASYGRISAIPYLLCAFLTAAMWLCGGRGRDRAAVLIGLSALCYASGLLIDTTGVFRGAARAVPAGADVAYLLSYPLFACGALSLPRRRLAAATSARIALDGVMIMLAALTFSWFFVLGPLLLAGGAATIATFVAAAYPLGDLLTSCCLLLVLSPAIGVPGRAGRALGIGLLLVLLGNVAFTCQIAAGTYVHGGPLDLLWATAHFISALAATALRRPVGGAAPGAGPSKLRWNLLPYTFLPAVVALLVYARHADTPPFLLDGLTMITGLLIVTVLVRQLLTVMENVRLQRAASENARRLEGLNAALEGAQAALLARNEELGRANARLEALATTDALTGLPNHRATAAAVDEALAQAHELARSSTLLFFDIDHFKAINDTHGHATGDMVLRELAMVARAALREGDYVGRWGGEEFVAILHGTAPEEAPTVAERLRATVAAHRFGVGAGLWLTCSIGLATAPQDGLTSAEVLHRADLAMYLAKRLGRNRVCVVADVADGGALGMGGVAMGADGGAEAGAQAAD